jgi:TrmH family RNA methyltransferase
MDNCRHVVTKSMLTSIKNPLVKQLRKLHQARHRHQQQQFLLEGTHGLEEAVATGYPMQVVCATPAWCEQHGRLWQQVGQRAERMELVSPEVLGAIATTVNPDGVVAVAPRRDFATVLTQPLQLGLAIETLQDPGNLGSVIRTAAAAGIDACWLSADSVDPDHPKVLRASAGQWFRLPMGVSDDLCNVVRQQQHQGVQVIATLPDATKTYWDLDLTHPTLILLGNEGAGLSPELTELADLQASIPLASGVESLNVAIAAALMLYEAKRQHRIVGLTGNPGMSSTPH